MLPETLSLGESFVFRESGYKNICGKKGFSIMKKTYKVNDNILLHYIPMKKLKTTAVGVYIHRELNYEEASLNALLPYVLKQGCKMCPDTVQIAHYLENLYGASLSAGIIKKGEEQIIAFDAETISDRFAANGEELLSGLMKLLLAMIFEPLCENNEFKAEYVEREKKNAVDRIKSVINDKMTYAQQRCLEEMCSGEPFAVSRLGTEEQIQKITAKELYSYYEKMISGSVIDIFVCGEADAEKLTDEIKNKNILFVSAERPKTNMLKKSSAPEQITEKMEITQGKLSIGFRTNMKAEDDDFIALMVANSVFGAGTHSKLFNNVREKLSLCYYASSRLERLKGLMTVNAGIEFENFEKAYDEILVQLEAVKNGDISDFEIESSVSALVNSYRTAYDDPRYLQGIWLGELAAGTNFTPEDYICKIQKITKDDIVRVMKNVELDTVYFLTGKGEEA